MPRKLKDRPCHHLYGRARWVRKARMQLACQPLCQMCMDDGYIVAAQVADHIKPHNGNEIEFWFGKLQSLCVDCHNNRKAMIERLGYDPTIGVDGYPIDRGHPVYSRGQGGLLKKDIV